MTDEDIILLFKQNHPASQAQIEALGIRTAHVGSGCSRCAHKIGQELVVKLPSCGCLRQSKQEIAAILAIHSDDRYLEIRKYTPPLYYGNPDTGVVVTKFYPGVVRGEENIEEIKKKFLSFGIYDLFDLNFRQDVEGNYFAIDLGAASGLIAQ